MLFRSVELSDRLKDLIVYKLDGEILHKEASQTICLDGEADVGTVIAF